MLQRYNDKITQQKRAQTTNVWRAQTTHFWRAQTTPEPFEKVVVACETMN